MQSLSLTLSIASRLRTVTWIIHFKFFIDNAEHQFADQHWCSHQLGSDSAMGSHRRHMLSKKTAQEPESRAPVTDPKHYIYRAKKPRQNQKCSAAINWRCVCPSFGFFNKPKCLASFLPKAQKAPWLEQRLSFGWSSGWALARAVVQLWLRQWCSFRWSSKCSVAWAVNAQWLSFGWSFCSLLMGSGISRWGAQGALGAAIFAFFGANY